MASLATAAIVAMSAVGANALLSGGSETNGAGSSTTSDAAATEVRTLTGRAVGEALGLEPITDPVVRGCDAFAQFREGAGFCIDGVSQDPTTLHLLQLQIAGQQRTPALEEFVRLTLRMEALQNNDAGLESDEYHDLVLRVRAIQDQFALDHGAQPVDLGGSRTH